MKTNELQDFHICISVPLKFSLLLPFSKTKSVLSLVNLFLICFKALSRKIGFEYEEIKLNNLFDRVY